MRIEILILKSLTCNEEYCRQVLPYIEPEFFSSKSEKTLFEKITAHVEKYNTVPSLETLAVELNNDEKVSERDFEESVQHLQDISELQEKDSAWLVDETEKWCQERKLFNAITESIEIMDGNGKQDKGAIPELLQKALSLSFDTHIGHDYLDDAEARWDYYTRKVDRIPFDIDYLNKITDGGIPKKTLNVILAGTGVGKSLAMCHMAATNLVDGKNVLYITLEMAEEEIAKRIDANLLNVSIGDLQDMPKDLYMKKIDKLNCNKRLVVKEYPPTSAGVAHFRHLLNELRMKQNFVPDVIYIDYLNICRSSRYKPGANVNSYTMIKAIAEELRGLAVEKNVPVISATQTNREGYSNTDVDLTNTSESFGLPMTVDFMIALISTEELDELGQILVKQLKNRYADPSRYKRFVVGIDRMKMRLHDVEQQAQEDLHDYNPEDDRPTMDRTLTGQRVSAERVEKWT